jgi:ABC-type amino acid transport substrate-binding protein
MPSGEHGVGQRSLSIRPCKLDHAALVEFSLQSINEKNIWNVQISCPGVEILENSLEETDRHHNYVIYTWPGQEESDVLMNLISEVEEIYTKASFDPRKRFLVVIPDTGNQGPSEAAASVLKELWSKYMILDILVLVPDITVREQLLLYTWYPYHDSRGYIVLVNSWVMEDDGYLLKNSELFLEKIPRKINCPPLRVAIMNVEPFVVLKGTHKNHSNEKMYIFEGPEIDLLHIITKHLNISFYYLPPPPDHLPFLDKLSSTIQKVVLGEADIGIGTLLLISDAASFADYTVPYFITGERWYVPCPKPFPRLEKVAAIFLPATWIMIVIVLLLVVILTWISAKRSDGNESRHYRSVSACFLNTFAVFLGVSVPDLPYTSLTRLCFFSFVWYSLAVITVFQTSFTSILVDPGVIDQIRSFEEMLSSGIEFGYNKDTHYYYYPEGSELYGEKEMLKHGQNCHDYKECLLRVITKGDYATLRSEIYAEYFVATTMPKRVKPLCSLEPSFKKYQVNAYMTKDTPLLDPFNTVIKRLLESGFVDKIVGEFINGWRYQAAPDAEKHNVGTIDQGYLVLSTEHLAIAFYVLVFGCGSSFLIFVGELLYCFSVKKLSNTTTYFRRAGQRCTQGMGRRDEPPTPKHPKLKIKKTQIL